MKEMKKKRETDSFSSWDDLYRESQEDANRKIGDAIYKLRREHKLTQEQLSEGICSCSTVSRIENGSFMPSKELLGKLLQRLRVKNHSYWFHMDGKSAFEEQMLENVLQMLEAENMDNSDRWLSALEDLKNSDGEKAEHLLGLLELIKMEDQSQGNFQSEESKSVLQETLIYGSKAEKDIWGKLQLQAGHVLETVSEEEFCYQGYVERTCDRMLAQSQKGIGTDYDMDMMFRCLKGVCLIRQGRNADGEELFQLLRSELDQAKDLYRSKDHRMAVCDINIAVASLKQNHLDQAERSLDRARKVVEGGSVSWNMLLRMHHVEIIIAILKGCTREEIYKMLQEARILCKIRCRGDMDAARELLQEEMGKRLLINVL